MCPASVSTATPSGCGQPLTSVFWPEPSGLNDSTRPPLKSSTMSRPVAVSVAAATVDWEGCCCAMSALQMSTGQCDQRVFVLEIESMPRELGDGDHHQAVCSAEADQIRHARHR